MRQWLGVNPKILCKNHLTGEFGEHFKIHGALRNQISLDGYFRSNCLELLSLQQRFNALRAEMKRRGYKHKSLKFSPELLEHLGHAKYIRINRKEAAKLLFTRCKRCRDNAYYQGFITAAESIHFESEAKLLEEQN